MLDKIRYAIALLLLASMPPAILYWYLIHPLAERWRSLPPWLTFTAVGLLSLPPGIAIYLARDTLLAVDYGFRWPLAAVGALLYGVALWIEMRCRRHLKFRILAGVPEISPSGPGELLTEGIYSQVRNPRYLDILLAVLGFALITNYLAVYLLWILLVPAFWILVLLEERELRRRFGAPYEAYCRRVPRFLPRSRRASPPA